MKKKILITNDLVLGGGVEKLMYDLVMAWHEKYDITVMSYKYDDRFYDVYPSDFDSIDDSMCAECPYAHGICWKKGYCIVEDMN